MASGQSLIVGGGIQSGSPFALNRLVYVTNVTPPQLSTYNANVATDAVSAVVYTDFPNSSGTSVTATNATETVRINGGMIVEGTGTDSVSIGRGAATGVGSNGTDQISIGRGVITGTVGTHRVAVGALANVSGGASVVVGYNSGSGSANAVGGVFIGDTTQASGNGGSANVVVIGDGALITLGNAGGGGGVAIGYATNIAHPSSVTIGYSASSSFSSNLGQNTVTIGNLASSTKAGTTVVGGAASTTQTTSTVIGSGATATGSGSSAIVIGQTASSSAGGAIVIGTASALTTVSIAIGNNAADLGAGVMQLGASGTPITVLVIGAGNTIASPAAKGIRFTDASGTNNPAGNLTFQAPLSTGNATPAKIIFTIGAVGASGATLQTATTVLTLDDQLATFAGAISAAGLPTSAGAAGTLWVDTGAGNVLKRA